MDQFFTGDFVIASVIVILIIVVAVIVFTVGFRFVRIAREARAQRLTSRMRPLIYDVAMADEDSLSSAIAAVEVLGKSDRRRGEKIALQLLTGIQGESRASLIQLLRAQGTTARARKMCVARSWVTRARGVEILGLVDGARTVDDIRPLTSDPVREVRVAAVRALGHCDDPVAVPILVGMLRKPDSVSATITSTALLSHAHQAHDLVLPLLYDEDPRVRRTAALLSGYLIATGTVAALEKAIVSDRDDSVRMALCRSLTIVQSRSSVAVLASLSGHNESAVLRRTIAGALASFPPQWTVTQRAELGKDPDREVRRAVTVLESSEGRRS
jgi:hypothetical protein